MDKERMNKIYTILVNEGGANEDDRDSFIYHHCDDKYGCIEWRFVGELGFGGKYRSVSNRVTMYREDETPKRLITQEKINEILKKYPNEN